MNYIPSSGRAAASFRTRTSLSDAYAADKASEKGGFLDAVAQQARLDAAGVYGGTGTASGLAGSTEAPGLASIAGISGLTGGSALDLSGITGISGLTGGIGTAGLAGMSGLFGGVSMSSLLSGQGSLFGINMMPNSLLRALALLEESQATAAAERMASRLEQLSAAQADAQTAANAANRLYQPSAASLADVQAAAGTQATHETAAVAAPSLEAMLKAKYPGLVYHVFDASSGYWRTRNDYPHHLLYQEGDEAKETLENWKPSGPNPFYGSVDGRFIAPKEIHALGSIPPGSKAVVIHPKVQQRMEQDPAYANEIFARIDTWFTFDVLRNEALHAGSTVDMSQAVAIGEDGNICNACSSTPGHITTSGDEMVQAYRRRMAKRAKRMREIWERQIEQGIETRRQNAACADARAQLTRMLESGRLREIFGGTIAGNSTEEILGLVRAELAGTAA